MSMETLNFINNLAIIYNIFPHSERRRRVYTVVITKPHIKSLVKLFYSRYKKKCKSFSFCIVESLINIHSSHSHWLSLKNNFFYITLSQNFFIVTEIEFSQLLYISTSSSIVWVSLVLSFYYRNTSNFINILDSSTTCNLRLQRITRAFFLSGFKVLCSFRIFALRLEIFWII